MSEFTVPIVRISSVQKHPNADTLSLTEVDGCPVIFKTDDLHEGNLAVYIPVDAVVPPNAKGLEFLGDRPKDRRIRAKRLRGIFSMGLLLPCSSVLPYPAHLTCKEGDDLAPTLGIVKYEEPEDLPPNTFGGKPNKRFQKDPKIGPVYELESWRKYKGLFVEGEEVIVTEKIHGTNFRFGVTPKNTLWDRIKRFFTNKTEYDFHLGSHKVWRDGNSLGVYGEIAEKYELREMAEKFPDYCFYGEIYGSGVQDLTYGAKEGERWLDIFDIYDHKNKRWLDYNELEEVILNTELNLVPFLYVGPYKEEEMLQYAQGKSLWEPTQMREGCIIRTYKERANARHDRTIYKLVGEEYLLRKGGTERH